MEKLVLVQKMISTRERLREHQFAGRKTQQTSYRYAQNVKATKACFLSPFIILFMSGLKERDIETKSFELKNANLV